MYNSNFLILNILIYNFQNRMERKHVICSIGIEVPKSLFGGQCSCDKCPLFLSPCLWHVLLDHMLYNIFKNFSITFFFSDIYVCYYGIEDGNVCKTVDSKVGIIIYYSTFMLLRKTSKCRYKSLSDACHFAIYPFKYFFSFSFSFLIFAVKGLF